MPELPAGLSIEVDDPAVLEDPEVKKLLQKTVESLDRNPLQKFHPHGKQRPFLAARKKTKVYLGGTRAGKSTAGVCDDLIQLCDREIIPAHLLPYKIWEPPFRCRVVTPDYGHSFASVLETFRKWTPESQLRGGSWDKAFREKEHILHFANGSLVDFLTLEQDVNKFGGVTRERIHYDEEPKGEKGEEIRWQGAMRLAEVNGDELFTYSPIHGLGWTHDEFEEKKGPEVLKDVWESEEMIVVRASIRDNPHMSPEGIASALEKIPEAVRASYESGNYTHFKGLVYPDFDAEIHVIDEKEITEEFVAGLEGIDGIDPGMQTTAVLFAGFDRDNCLTIFDELPLSGNTAIPENAAERILAVRNRWNLPECPKYTLIDPAARSRDLASGERVDQAYRRAGIKVLPAQNEVEPGVFEVMRRMENRDPEGNPAPLIRISSRCKELIREIGRYRMNPKEDGSFDVVKKDDHFVDVMRYLCMARPTAPRRRKKQRQVARGWIPGTAPEYVPAKPRTASVLGPYV